MHSHRKVASAFHHLILSVIPRMTPKLTRILSLLRPCSKTDARCGWLPAVRAARTMVKELIWHWTIRRNINPHMATRRHFVVLPLCGIGYARRGECHKGLKAAHGRLRRHYALTQLVVLGQIYSPSAVTQGSLGLYIQIPANPPGACKKKKKKKKKPGVTIAKSTAMAMNRHGGGRSGLNRTIFLVTVANLAQDLGPKSVGWIVWRNSERDLGA